MNSLPAARTEARSKTAGRPNRLYVVEGAAGHLLDRTLMGTGLSAEAQARRVAAQVEWEVARQARRRIVPARPAGTLLLLPVRCAVRPSLRTRSILALRRIFGVGPKPLLNT